MDVKALLDDYKIKKMAGPKKAEALETSLSANSAMFPYLEPLMMAHKYGKSIFRQK